ncbi:ABC transporter ATP-binding protein [Aliirhizobium cellulosilyticum]|uniref:Osmoprotectant transport system ATP-binding protein n=1 Tax=Aliirhizobium cellulosilyticum TaxID=393664 RepID=A0A7W6SBF8_9HYPH|nr:ABC transporter ATP-binding protein [Rhizobium cellulosilyticum]MBB4349872.1 osmoprotectant transport system ATP-binding protein [Rhizobium cellulosilyticum]MBB4413051.1 osmoprotectant transport system ATP-binding protein [Rhizobium cellulosilyticum]MBB4448012.1 osmoprotectant transport system ATP-binding protein [Rhizobium cellulosilyticum]
MIDIQSVTKRYGGKAVVDSVSFAVPEGTIAVLVGTSGSGKTTLLRMINQLVSQDEGTILIGGEDTRNIPGHELRRRIGYAIQGHGLFPHRTVAENIATVPRLLKWDKSRIDARVAELLDLFQLDPAAFAARYPHQLSGGQQQRVGVARALAAEPKILLMDEPFGALDPVLRGKAQDELLAIQKRFGTTIVIVTHDINEAFHLGDTIAVMDKGRLLQYGHPIDLLKAPATSFVEGLVGTFDRPFRLLSLDTLAGVIEPGEAEGEPIEETRTRQDALAALMWSGADALPVASTDGKSLGRVRLQTLLRQAVRPQ